MGASLIRRERRDPGWRRRPLEPQLGAAVRSGMAHDPSRPDREAAALREQNQTIAAFGLRALRSDVNLDPLLQEACELAARGLRTPIAKVMEALPGGHELLLRAEVGIPPEIAAPGKTTVPAGPGSAAGYALAAGRPIVSDVATETRFAISEVVRRCGVRTSANVLIPGEGSPFGALEVDSFERRDFTSDDLAFLQNYANVLGAAVERQRAAVRLQALAREREVLLRELQHRVKNDLQVITALLVMEAGQTQNVETRARLESIGSRIDTLSHLHERLYSLGRVDVVDLADYFGELCSARFRMHGLALEGDIRLELRLAPLSTNHDRAAPLGLIVNEFVTNSLKYAFPMGRGVIRLTLNASAAGCADLLLEDTGVGIPEHAQRASAGSGMRLIHLLAEQLGAKATWLGGPGTRLSLVFAL